MERFVVGIISGQYCFCHGMSQCLCAGSAVPGGKEGGWLPSWAGSWAEGGACGTAPRSLFGLRKSGMCWLFFFPFFLIFKFFFPSCDIELILSCSLWEVTEVSLWCGVSWMKSVCCLCSAFRSSWGECSAGRRDVAAAVSGFMCFLHLACNSETWKGSLFEDWIYFVCCLFFFWNSTISQCSWWVLNRKM